MQGHFGDLFASFQKGAPSCFHFALLESVYHPFFGLQIRWDKNGTDGGKVKSLSFLTLEVGATVQCPIPVLNVVVEVDKGEDRRGKSPVSSLWSLE